VPGAAGTSPVTIAARAHPEASEAIEGAVAREVSGMRLACPARPVRGHEKVPESSAFNPKRARRPLCADVPGPFGIGEGQPSREVGCQVQVGDLNTPAIQVPVSVLALPTVPARTQYVDDRQWTPYRSLPLPDFGAGA
jgi:hypothetical protein